MKCLVNNLRKGTCTTRSLSNAAVIPPKHLASTIVCSQELHVVPFLAIGLNWAPDHFFWCPPDHAGSSIQIYIFHKPRTLQTSLTLLPSHLQLSITFFGLNIHDLLGCLAQVTHCMPYICSSLDSFWVEIIKIAHVTARRCAYILRPFFFDFSSNCLHDRCWAFSWYFIFLAQVQDLILSLWVSSEPRTPGSGSAEFLWGLQIN